ncbi:helix-turn-helix domain-containing protein [Exilibacterium tricleocarpae]|nr:helix-turn-helix domain-containing protein [Exilibacterium tricleocarpae]
MENFILGDQNTLTFSTESIDNKEKFDYWIETVCKQLIFVDCKRHDNEPFEGTLRTNNLSNITFSEMYTVPQTFFRSKQQLAQLEEDFLIASIPLTFSVEKSINRRPIPSARGDISIFDGSREQFLFVKDSINALIIIIPKASIKHYLPCPEDFAGRVISKNTPTGFLASNYVRTIASQIGRLDPGLESPLGDNLLQLFALALANTKENANQFAPAVKYSLCLQIKRYIEANLHDPDLSPKSIADAHKVSLRYLYNVFEQEKFTVSRFIMMRRLQRSRDALANPENTHLSITAIALDHGFKDTSHFSRTFKKEFGFTAKDLREITFPKQPAHPPLRNRL